jgi:hypothetical protein
MKRIMLLLGLLLAIVVPALLVGQNKPNVTESNVVEPNISDPNYLISKKTELEIRVIQLEDRVVQLEKQVRILFADSLYDRANIVEIWNGEMAIIDYLPPQRTTEGQRIESPFKRYEVPLSRRPPSKYPKGLDLKEEAAWKKKMLEDPCDIKQKK